jgi:hypothetical protein
VTDIIELETGDRTILDKSPNAARPRRYSRPFFMLGNNGESNECVSFKYYPFLKAYQRGDVTRMMVGGATRRAGFASGTWSHFVAGDGNQPYGMILRGKIEQPSGPHSKPAPRLDISFTFICLVGPVDAKVADRPQRRAAARWSVTSPDVAANRRRSCRADRR